MATSRRPYLFRAVLLATLVLLQVPWWFLDIPAHAKVAAALWLSAALLHPASIVLAFAALSPLPALLAGYLDMPGQGWRVVTQMALATAAGVAARVNPSGRTWLGPAAGCFAIVGAASSITQLAPLFAVQMSYADGLREVWKSAISRSPWPLILQGWIVVAAVAGGWAVEVLARNRPQLIRPLIALALAGQAIAASLNVQRIVVAAAARTGAFWEALALRLVYVRVSLQTDFNAAASIFVLGLLAAFSLSDSRRRRWLIALLQAVVAAGLWVTSSRMGMLAALIATALAAGWSLARRLRRPKVVGGVVATALVVLTAVFLGMYPAGRNDTVRGTASSRMVMMRIGWDMFRTAPVFGIGVGQFYEQSPHFAGRSLVPVARNERENAHNNFVQVLAEQGLVGLAALCLVTGVLLWQTARNEWTAPDRTRLWLAAAVTAAVLTWVTGHPLLTAEFSTVFWIFCGLLAATLPAPGPLFTRSMTGAAALLAIILPLRVMDARNDAALDHRGLQLSLWQHDDEQRYREAGTAFSVFLPGKGTTSFLPLRKMADAPNLVVHFTIGSKELAAVALADSLWHEVPLQMPDGRRAFERVDAVVEGAPAPANPEVWLRVGRAH